MRDQIPVPANEDAERAVIKAVFENGRNLDAALYALEEHHFHALLHRRVWAAIVAAARESSAANTKDGAIAPSAVVARLADAGDQRAFKNMLLEPPAVLNGERFGPSLELVRKTYARRAAVEQTQRVLFEFAEGGAFASLDALSERIAAIAATGEDDEECYPIGARRVRDDLERRVLMRKGVRGDSTGLSKLDRVIGGISKKKLYVVGAYAGVAKSTLVWQIAVTLAQNGRSVLFFATEMDAQEYVERTACTFADVPHEDYVLGDYDGDQADELLTQYDRMSALPIVFYDPRDPQVAWLRHAVKKHKPDVVVIDYLQDVQGNGNHRDRFDMVNHVSREIAHLKKLDVAVICAAQLNRGSQQGALYSPPELHHLRDSGRIEMDADVVALLHRPGLRDEDVPLSKLEVWVRKVRAMKPGYVELYQPPGKYWLEQEGAIHVPS